MKHKICAITGHRFASLPFKTNESDPRCKALKNALKDSFINLIESKGIDTFLCGMALGSDQIAFEILLQLKKQFPSISLHAYIPCKEQYQKWSQAQVARFRAILMQVDEIVRIGEEYTLGCMQKRNRAMVDACDVLLAVYSAGRGGGTKSTLEYAKKSEKEIYILDPQKL